MRRKKKDERYEHTLCWNCANACGNCSWSGYDKAAKRVRFQPVEGWVAIPQKILVNRERNGKRVRQYETSYIVINCPEFRRG